MKAFYLFLLGGCLSSGSAWAQQLRGGYAAKIQDSRNKRLMGAQYYWFDNSHFKHIGYGCLGAYFGGGTYHLQGDSLILQFETWTKPAPLAVVADSLANAPVQAITVHVMDANTHQPVEWGSVTARLVRFRTNVAGKARLPYFFVPGDTIAITAGGYKSAFIVPTTHYQGYTVLMQQESRRASSNSRVSFLLKHRDAKGLVLDYVLSFYYQALSEAENKKFLATYQELLTAR